MRAAVNTIPFRLPKVEIDTKMGIAHLNQLYSLSPNACNEMLVYTRTANLDIYVQENRVAFQPTTATASEAIISVGVRTTK